MPPMSPPRSRKMSASRTRQNILDAAERLFSRYGFAATSLRRVTRDAGVNLAAVNYHFGSKEALVAAVFERRLEPLNQRRLASLETAEQQAGEAGPALEEILWCLIEPTLDMAREEAARFALLTCSQGQIHDEATAEVAGSMRQRFHHVSLRFRCALAKALPDLEESQLDVRFEFVLNAIAVALGAPRRKSATGEGDNSEVDLDALANTLVTFLAAGLMSHRNDATVDTTDSRQSCPEGLA